MNLRIDVKYQTLTLPPPYSYAYTLRTELTEQTVAITVDWQYTDRDELSEEELWEEGFTSDDDFQWQGTLPVVWKITLNELLGHTTLLPTEAVASEHSSLAVTLTDTGGKVTTGVPDNVPRWNYQLQELVQGVYEAAQRERPLCIRYLDISQANRPTEVTINISFLHRQLTVITPQTQKLPWDRVHLLLETLYLPDYYSEQSSAVYPRQPGRYIDPGDEQWYRLGTSVVSPGKKDVLSILHQMMLDMVADN